jgi:hypothetical protein
MCISIKEESSVTTQEAYQMMLENGKPKSAYAKKRNHLKNKKLISLMQVLSSHEHHWAKHCYRTALNLYSTVEPIWKTQRDFANA